MAISSMSNRLPQYLLIQPGETNTMGPSAFQLWSGFFTSMPKSGGWSQ